MRIANPIYDVVFRYLMEDNKVARLLLSAILEKEIVELKFNPTEQATTVEHSVMVFRMDFSAKVKDKDGKEEVVLIELQRAKYYFQMMRFRRYLGKQYQNPQNSTEVRVTKGGNIIKKGIPIFPIYILGEAFTESKIPVIRVSRSYIDVATKKEMDERHDFIEGLTHDAIVIQIPYLKEKRRTELEQFLEIFDQSNVADTKYYGDQATDSLMLKKKNLIENESGKKLLPTYSFWRCYTQYADLEKHTDRPSCEISVSVNINSDGTSWPIFMEGTSLDLKKGDAVLYLGCEVVIH